MKGNIEERAVALAEYIIEQGATVRAAAAKFGLSKSTVHTERTKWNAYTCRGRHRALSKNEKKACQKSGKGVKCIRC